MVSEPNSPCKRLPGGRPHQLGMWMISNQQVAGSYPAEGTDLRHSCPEKCPEARCSSVAERMHLRVWRLRTPYLLVCKVAILAAVGRKRGLKADDFRSDSINGITVLARAKVPHGRFATMTANE